MALTQGDLQDRRDAIVDDLPTRAPIYLPTDKVSLEDQIKGLGHVKTVYETSLDALYRPRLRALRKHFKGTKRCFIIGNGPSLNDTDLSLLKDEVTFAVNGFFLKQNELDWRPTFYMVEDHLVAEDRAEALNTLQGSIKLFPAYLAYCLNAQDDTIFFNHRPRKSYPHGFDFSHDAAVITYTGCTVTFTAMQMAAYLGFDEIYLIGVDASYDIPSDAKQSTDYATGVLDMKSDDPNHFHPDYFGKGFRWHDPQVNKMLEAYGEANLRIQDTGQKILNATIGGKLEVFPRVDYAALFPPKASKPSRKKLPKTLLIDFTKIGGATATGELKATYFKNWAAGDLLHVFGKGRETLGLGDGHTYKERAISPEQIQKNIEEFVPELIIYRPVGDNRALHEFAMETIAKLKIPHVIWLMDDWPARLMDYEPAYARLINADLTELCTSAAQNFAISIPMAGAFGARYGGKFEVFHNGIDPKLWEPLQPNRQKNSVRVRYAGGLAADMNLQSVREVAHAVNQLAKDGPVSLEILTHAHWLREHGAKFDDNVNVTLSEANLSHEAYRQWLLDADILLIASNFDEASSKYTRYSFANKMPEYLASGSAILAYGPPGLASMDILSSISGVTRVAQQDPEKLSHALGKLVNSARTRTLRGKKTKAYALSNFNINTFVENFEKHLAHAQSTMVKPISYDAARREINTVQGKAEKKNIARYFQQNALLKHLGRYIFGWKGAVGLSAALASVTGVIVLMGQQSPVHVVLGAALVFLGQILNFVLIAHLAAHTNRSLER